MVDAGALIAIVTSILGLAGIIFAALSWRSNDTKTVVDTQSSVLRDMAALNDELRQRVDDLRTENAELRGQIGELRDQVGRLTDELRRFAHDTGV
jgi:cell division protein FtsB